MQGLLVKVLSQDPLMHFLLASLTICKIDEVCAGIMASNMENTGSVENSQAGQMSLFCSATLTARRRSKLILLKIIRTHTKQTDKSEKEMAKLSIDITIWHGSCWRLRRCMHWLCATKCPVCLMQLFGMTSGCA